MSMNYDNWERLVAAVIKRQQIWELCHQHSRTPSTCSEASSSDFSSSFRSSNLKLRKSQESAQRPIPRLLVIDDFKSSPWLGKGRFGPSTLVQLRRGVRVSDQLEFLAKGTELVLKKLVGEMEVTEQEFSIVFGNCRHQNVVAPRAYFFSGTGEYYIFKDYNTLGSLHDILHEGNSCLNWESRLRIAIGAARGIAHIHGLYGGKLAHGNVKSSNIFVNSEQYGCVSDFGLSGIMKSPGKQVTAIYRAAEFDDVYKIKHASHQSDVCCFGVVLLELLTGTSPMEPQPVSFRRNVHVVEWALSMRSEDWDSKLFDQSLWSSELSYRSLSGLICDEVDVFNFGTGLERELKIKAEMVEMMQVARRCLAMSPEDRPEMSEVVMLLENVVTLPYTQPRNRLRIVFLVNLFPVVRPPRLNSVFLK